MQILYLVLRRALGGVLSLAIYGENNNFRFLGWDVVRISRFILIHLHTFLISRFLPFPLYNDASLLPENSKSK